MANNSYDRRVVITGMGVVTPLGHDLDTFWQNLITGQCGIDTISSMYGTGQSLYSTPNTSFSICFHWRCDVLVSPSFWKLRIICRSFRSLASPTRSTNTSPD